MYILSTYIYYYLDACIQVPSREVTSKIVLSPPPPRGGLFPPLSPLSVFIIYYNNNSFLACTSHEQSVDGSAPKVRVLADPLVVDSSVTPPLRGLYRPYVRPRRRKSCYSTLYLVYFFFFSIFHFGFCSHFFMKSLHFRRKKITPHRFVNLFPQPLQRSIRLSHKESGRPQSVCRSDILVSFFHLPFRTDRAEDVCYCCESFARFLRGRV